jgi:hypothetical protein
MIANVSRMSLLPNGNERRSKKSRDSVLLTKRKSAERRNNSVDRKRNVNVSCNGNESEPPPLQTRRKPHRGKPLRKDDKKWSGQSKWELHLQQFDHNRVVI